MMASDLENGRPNIRIEIKNLTEAMEVDDEEEGEIRDNLPKVGSHTNNSEIDKSQNFKEVLKKNIDNLTELKVDHRKLQERARRFALKPEEISTFTEEDLRNLYLSLGVTADTADEIRFEAIHLKSSNQISVDNVVAYFMEYAPLNIEFVDDESYNLVWEDKLCAARTLFHISKIVRGMPVRVATEHVIDSFILEEGESSKDVELLAQNRQIELREDNVEEINKLYSENTVNVSSINIPIPPGYWRLGKKLINSYSVLLRFSMKTDQKPFQIDKCIKYYKNNFSNRIKEKGGIFSRNKDIHKEASDKNPWGILAKNWDEDVMFREREWYKNIESSISNAPPASSENSESRVRLAAKRRLGKRQTEEEDSKKTSTSEKDQSDESDEENKRKGPKMPRMRMYADDEEEKIKRKKLLQTLKTQSEKLKKTEIPNSDLRNILRITNKKPKIIERDEDLDLSLNLRNRSRKLVFTVSQDQHSKQIGNSSILDRLERRGHKTSPVKERKPISPIRFQRDPSHDRDWPDKEIGQRRRTRRISVKREKSPERRYSGRMYSSRGDSDDYSVHKPKSKVALVIKTQKKPTVASAIQSRSRKFDTSSSSSSEDSSSEESESESSEEGSGNSSSSTSSESEMDSSSNGKSRNNKKISKPPFKVQIQNEQYKRK